MKLQVDLEVRSRNILLAPELWKGSLHQTTSNRLYNKQLNFFRESPCTMVAPDFLGTSSVNSLRIGKGHTSSKEPFGNLIEKE